MSKILKRGKVWYIDYIYKGKRIRRSLKTSSKKVAELALKNIDVQIAKEELDLSGIRKILFIDFSARFLKWYRVQNSERSHEDYNNLFNSAINPYFQNCYLSNINTEMIENYKIKRFELIRPATVNKELSALRHLFNKAILWGYIRKNPVVGVRRLSVMERKIRFLSLKEIDLVLRNSPEYLRRIIVIAIHTGLRKSELFRLRWEDVDFSRGYVNVSSMDEEYTKNYRNREIPMTEQLKEYLDNLEVKSEWVLCKQNDERYSGWLRKGLEKVARDAGIKKFTLHDLRNTFASHLVMEGVDLPTVQNLMGHSDIKTTMIFSHLAPDHLKNAMKRYSARLGNDTNMAH